MNFYCAHYKNQYFNQTKHAWVDTYYQPRKIVVIANNYADATDKIDKCLNDANNDEFRSISIGDVVECIGLKIVSCSEGGANVLPVIKEPSLEDFDQ